MKITLMILFGGLSLFWFNQKTSLKLTDLKDLMVDTESFPTQTSAQALAYCRKNNLDTTISVFVDLSKRSGSKRLFLVNLENGKILLTGLVAHGHCQSYLTIQAEFSNEIGSNCSSEGHYRIGAKYSGGFGTAYKLHGLDRTNSNAFKRFIVLHAHSCVPDNSTTANICRSEGCPTVSPNFLKSLEPYLDKSKKPILLWMYK